MPLSPRGLVSKIFHISVKHGGEYKLLVNATMKMTTKPRQRFLVRTIKRSRIAVRSVSLEIRDENDDARFDRKQNKHPADS